ncbi:hypothetical protein [uncultured Thiohalocapsa sp.]|uniref:hypothetical protein n=1 Tax=uncultured Thiohalocapsa sp. TaxID=768990 RepID=UPI0025F7E49B|nr:hypothetical protein [uncultured Thiohalocapsa sp.]
MTTGDFLISFVGSVGASILAISLAAAAAISGLVRSAQDRVHQCIAPFADKVGLLADQVRKYRNGGDIEPNELNKALSAVAAGGEDLSDAAGLVSILKDYGTFRGELLGLAESLATVSFADHLGDAASASGLEQKMERILPNLDDEGVPIAQKVLALIEKTWSEEEWPKLAAGRRSLQSWARLRRLEEAVHASLGLSVFSLLLVSGAAVLWHLPDSVSVLWMSSTDLAGAFSSAALLLLWGAVFVLAYRIVGEKTSAGITGLVLVVVLIMYVSAKDSANPASDTASSQQNTMTGAPAAAPVSPEP